LNDKHANLPNVPHFLPLYSDPSASAASSNTGIPYSLAIAIISSILAGIPYRCTGIIALGFLPVSLILSLIAIRRRSGDIFHVSISLSINTGEAPRYLIGFAEATKVKL
jgi:hypothetical protein